MRNMKVNWSGLDSPDNDLCVLQKDGYYDIVNSCDGWAVMVPGGGRYAHNGREWVRGTLHSPPRGVPGAVTRDEARVFAESLMNDSNK